MKQVMSTILWVIFGAMIVFQTVTLFNEYHYRDMKVWDEFSNTVSHIKELKCDDDAKCQATIQTLSWDKEYLLNFRKFVSHKAYEIGYSVEIIVMKVNCDSINNQIEDIKSERFYVFELTDENDGGFTNLYRIKNLDKKMSYLIWGDREARLINMICENASRF